MSEKTTAFHQVHRIPASPAAVYRALIDPEEHAAFTGSEATGEPKVGAAFTAWDGYIHGKIVELEEDRKIVQAWSTTEWPADQPPSKVEIRLEPDGDETRLTLVHSEVPESQAESYRQGWIDYYWSPLQQYFQDRKA